jgi:hypothetical protein
VSFVSVSERFDTSSAAGRLLRNIMLTFAQFEREMTSERIKDKFEQKAKKGLWNGAIPPFGYKSVDKKLVVDKPRASVVRSIFEEFVTSGSFVHTVEGIKSKEVINPRTGLRLSVSLVGRILRNPVYSGKVIWRQQVLPGLHEPIVSEELFGLAQEFMREKVVKKRLHKKFLLGGLVKCSGCGSTMTNAYTNKKTSRYYYYKCTKVVKEGKNACTIKEVNAERLEQFISENLSRIASDRQYIENLVFRMMHQQPRQMGFELTDEWVKNTADQIQQVLIDFKNGIQAGSQVERCLVFQRTIEKINFSKETLEVVVSLTVGRADLAGKADLRRVRLHAARAEMAAGIRVGEHESRSCTHTESSNKILAERQGFEPWKQFDPFTGLANRCLQPLGHLSKR